MAALRAAAGSDVEVARRRLAELKAKMDNAVAAGRADRATRGTAESLVVRTIELGDPEKSQPE